MLTNTIPLGPEKKSPEKAVSAQDSYLSQIFPKLSKETKKAIEVRRRQLDKSTDTNFAEERKRLLESFPEYFFEEEAKNLERMPKSEAVKNSLLEIEAILEDLHNNFPTGSSQAIESESDPKTPENVGEEFDLWAFGDELNKMGFWAPRLLALAELQKIERFIKEKYLTRFPNNEEIKNRLEEIESDIYQREQNAGELPEEENIKPLTEEEEQTQEIDRQKELDERIRSAQEELIVIRARLAEIREKKEKPEVNFYSTDFIEKQILQVLQNSGDIGEIKSLKVNGHDKVIIIDSTIKASGFNIGIQIIMGNNSNGVYVKNHHIDASRLAKGKAEKAIAPHIGKISGIIKNYIETKEGKKVAEMKIEGGELKVTFEHKN